MSERLISQLAHVELFTPTPGESARFLTEVMGLEESGRDGDSIYLRCWGDFFFHSIQLTQAARPGLGHVGWRAQGPDALERAADRLDRCGAGEGWIEGQRGHGPAYRYRGPGGHLHEIFWEVERYQPPADKRSSFPARAQRHSPRGVAARQLDHVTVTTRDPYADSEWYRDTLGYRFMEYTALDDNPDLIVFSMVTTNEKSHDLGLVIDFSGVPGRINHLAFWLDSVEDVLRAADVLLESGTEIEFGPGRHGMGEQTYLYFREPGGMRFEVNSGGYRNYQPDWLPVKWLPSEGSNTMYRNLNMPDSMTDSFPPAEAAHVPVPAAANPWSRGAAH